MQALLCLCNDNGKVVKFSKNANSKTELIMKRADMVLILQIIYDIM